MHSWKKFADIFENEPLFAEVLEEIEVQRQEIDVKVALIEPQRG